MFKEYFLEEYGKETLEFPEGFVMYVLNKEHQELFFSDFYVKPEFRKTYAAKRMFEKVKDFARDQGCTVVTGLVSFGEARDNARMTRVLRTYLSCGFTVYAAKNGQVLIGVNV